MRAKKERDEIPVDFKPMRRDGRGRPRKKPFTIPKDANIIKPQKGGQTKYFKAFKVDEVLFGGAAGGGKSFSLIVDALGLQYIKHIGKSAVEIPEYRAIIFRRKTTQLQQLLTEARRYYLAPPFNAEYVAKRTGYPSPAFVFPSGAIIFLCHLEQELDVENHQGAEYSFIGFDELSQFTAFQYSYMLTRLRTTIPNFHTRVRATTNPTGAGLIWVKKRFIRYGQKKLEPNKVYYFKHDYEHDFSENPAGIMTEAGDSEAKTRCFIPGFLYENRVLMESDPNYERNIKAMGKRWARALLEGDWEAFVGSFFDDYTPEMEIEPFNIEKSWELFAGLDPGYSSPASFTLFARDFSGNVYALFTYKVGKRSPDKHAKEIRTRLKGFPYTDGRIPPYCASGVDAWAKKDRHALISNELIFADFFQAKIPEMYMRRAITDRVAGWWAIKYLMRARKFYIFKGFNDDLIDEILSAEADDKDPEDIDRETRSTFHSLDGLRYGVMSIQHPDEPEPEDEMHEDDVWNTKPQKDHRAFWQ